MAGVSATHVYAQSSVEGTATFYADYYEGHGLGCPGAGLYSASDPTIAAVSPAHYLPLPGETHWPCGQVLIITGPAGQITVTRQDACGGCDPEMIDLSRRGSEIVCGAPAHTCPVTITRP